MTAAGVLNPNARIKAYTRSLSETVHAVGKPTPLINQLNTDYLAQSMKAHAVRSSRNPRDIAMRKVAEAKMAELAEQIRLWKAMSDPDGKRLHEALSVRRFERETRRMKAGQL